MEHLFLAGPTVRRDFERPPASLIAAAARCQPATLHEAAGRMGALPSAIKPAAPGFILCGPAFTVHGPGSDNLWLHRALTMAQPGDILVAYVSDQYEAGYWGEVMSTMAKAQKLGGLLIDGGVRDGSVLGDIGFPVFARQFCLQGTGKDFGAIGWLNAPLLIGNVTVHPGDLVSGDCDGVVVIPKDKIAKAVQEAEVRENQEREILHRLISGESTLDIYNLNR